MAQETFTDVQPVQQAKQNGQPEQEQFTDVQPVQKTAPSTPPPGVRPPIQRTEKEQEPGVLDVADQYYTEKLAPKGTDYDSLWHTETRAVPKTLGRETLEAGKTALGFIPGIYHAFADEATPEEKERYAEFEKQTGEAPGTETSGLKRIGLGLHRMLGTDATENAIHDYASGNVTPEAALSVAPEAVGSGAGNVVAGETLHAGLKEPTVRKTITAPVRAASRAAERVAPFLPTAVGAGIGSLVGHPWLGAAAGRVLVPEEGIKAGIERGKVAGLSPEEAAHAKLEDRAVKSEREAAAAKKELDAYSASTEQGVEAPEDVTKKYEKAAKKAAEDRFHADAAKERLQKATQPDQPIEADHMAGFQRDIDSLAPKGVAAPEAKPIRPINVKGPGEIAPEVFPQEQAKPNVDTGATVHLAREEGVRVGKPKLLAEENPTPETPKQEILPPEKPVKVGKPERGNVRALTVDEQGNVIDKEETPEGRIESLIRKGLEPEKKSPLGRINTEVPEQKVTEAPLTKESPKVESTKEEKTVDNRVAERRVTPEEREPENERRQNERRVLNQMSDKMMQEGITGKGGEKRIDTDAYAKAMAQARKELGPDASVQKVIERRDKIVSEQGKSAAGNGDIGEQARNSNPEPTRAETKKPEVKDIWGEREKYEYEKKIERRANREKVEAPERSPEARDAEPKVHEQIANLRDEKLKQLAKAHGLDPENYDFDVRDKNRHRVDRDNLVKDIAAKMGDDEVQNIARNAQRLDNQDTASFAKADRAERVFPRLRGPVDEFGNAAVAGGSPAADVEAEELKKETEKTSSRDTDHVKAALDELGTDAKLSDVMKRAQEMKDAANKPVDVAKSADDYNAQEKLPKIEPEKVDRDERAAEIADDYQKMKHEPNDPHVKKSYKALVDDVKKQWDYATKKMGIKIEPVDEDPYHSYEEMKDDVLKNKTMKVWRGGNPLPEDHPLAAVDPKTGESYNTMFRAVHDIFGHVAQDHDFSEPGEESAWNVHRQMMNPDAVPAMTTETRGQTSWFYNHEGVRGGEPLGKFAEQKAGLLPEYANERTPEAGKTLDHIKSGKPFAVLTAENPDNGRISDAENAARNRKLVAELKEKGYKPVPVEGNTKDVEGQKEHSFFVPDIKPEDAAEIGRKHGQAAILTNKGLHDLKTDTVNPSDNAKVMTGEEARKQPYYSRVGDQDFSVPIDFDKRVNTKGAPLDEFGNPTVSGGAPEAGEAKAKSKKMPTPDELIEKHGETDDPGNMAFLLKDGRGVKMPLGQIHDQLLGGKATDASPRREQFIKDEGAIRMRKSGAYGDRQFHMSMPESGISEAQLEKLKKMGPQMATGRVFMEVANPFKDSAYRVVDVPAKDFSAAFEKNLRELVPVLNDKGAPVDEFGNPTVSGGSGKANFSVKKDPDFTYNGTWHVKGDNFEAKMFRDPESTNWYEDRYNKKGDETEPRLLSVTTKEEALKRLGELYNEPYVPAEKDLSPKKGDRPNVTHDTASKEFEVRAPENFRMSGSESNRVYSYGPGAEFKNMEEARKAANSAARNLRIEPVPTVETARMSDAELKKLGYTKADIENGAHLPEVSGGSQGAAPAKAKIGALPKRAEENLLPEEKAGVTKSQAGRDSFVNNMMSLPSVQEVTDIAKAGEGGKNWYQRSTKAFDHMLKEAPNYFKPEDRNPFLNFLASLSPQQSVAMNMREALHTWREYVDAGRPTGKPLEKLLRDNLTLPNTKIPNAVKSLSGENLWPDLSKNTNFKVPSFGENLQGNLDRATNDGWMALFNGLDAKDMSKAHVYHAVSAVTREAAKALGWKTAEAQAAVWAFTKVFTEQGETIPEQIRQYSEDFADIMRHDPETRQLLQNLGVDLGKLDTKLKGIGPKPKITAGASPTTENSIRKLTKRIEAARGKGTIPPPKSGRLGFEDEPDEATEFNPEKLDEEDRLKTNKKSRLGKIGK